MSGIIFNYTLMFVAILLVASLAGYLSERVGIVNIGIDGMMCFGAVFFAIFSAPMFKMSNVGPGMFIFPLMMTMTLTSITGVMHAFASIKLKANHIISGTVINLIGVAFASFVNAPLGNVFYGQTRLASGFNDFLYLGNSIYGSSIIMCLLAVIIVVIIFIFMHYTRVGLRYRAVGENPNAVDAQGISVTKYQWIGVILSSVLAGFAGAMFMFNIKQFGGNTQGLGFLALGIMIAGAWKIEWIALIATCFSLFTALSYTNVLTNLGVPRAIAFAIPYILVVVVLLAFSKRTRAPAHDGIPFDKTKR